MQLWPHVFLLADQVLSLLRRGASAVIFRDGSSMWSWSLMNVGVKLSLDTCTCGNCWIQHGKKKKYFNLWEAKFATDYSLGFIRFISCSYN